MGAGHVLKPETKPPERNETKRVETKRNETKKKKKKNRNNNNKELYRSECCINGQVCKQEAPIPLLPPPLDPANKGSRVSFFPRLFCGLLCTAIWSKRVENTEAKRTKLLKN